MSGNWGRAAAVAVIIIIAYTVLVLAARADGPAAIRDCATLGEDISRLTVWRDDECLVEVSPGGMLISVEDIIFYLDYVGPVDTKEVKDGN